MGVIPNAGGGVSYEPATAASVGAIPEAEKGAPNGVATLDGTGVVPMAELPVTLTGEPNKIPQLDSGGTLNLNSATFGAAYSSDSIFVAGTGQWVNMDFSSLEIDFIKTGEDSVSIGITGVDAGSKPITTTRVPSAAGDVLNKAFLDAQKGAPNGIATLDANGKVSASELPPLDHDAAEANSEAAMLALSITSPAICIRTDFTPAHVFYLTADPASTLANWTDTGEFGGGAADPSATVGLTAKNGVATSYMRSDGAPALDQAIVPTWTGAHTFSGNVTLSPASILVSEHNAATGGSGSSVQVKATTANGTPFSAWANMTFGTNQKWWDAGIQGPGPGKFQLRTVDDGNTAAFPWLSATRGSGNTVSAIESNSGSGSWAHTGTFSASGAATFSNNLSVSGSATCAGNVYVAGQLGSAANTSAPSPTNSGITLGGSPTWAMASFYDQANAANGRSADILLISNSFKFRFANDARTGFLDFLTISGGQLGVTGISSTSGSGAWVHTGAFATTKAISAVTGADGNKLWLAKYSSGSGHTDAPKTLDATSTYLQVGGREYGSLGFAGIGFGYVADPTQNPCVWIGHEETDTSANTSGDFVVATRPTTTNVAPTERFRITAAGEAAFTNTVKTGGYTVATLPAAAAGLQGARAFVTDSAASPVFLAAVTGGGSTVAPVFCDGTNWKYG